MVTLTDEYIEKILKACKSNEKPHLLLPNSKIKKIAHLKKHKKFLLMDLRNNGISSLWPLANQLQLRFLFLQNNDITSLEGFSSLKSLEALYLDFNRIEVVENLEGCPLRKLSLKGQRLGGGKTLALDVNTLSDLAQDLDTLNLAKNGLTEARPIRYLRRLQELDLSDNRLASWGEGESLGGVLTSLYNLKRLNLLRNPVMKNRSTVKLVIANVPKLEKFNGLEVTQAMKTYCRETTTEVRRERGAVSLGELLELSAGDLPTSLRPRTVEEEAIRTAGVKAVLRTSVRQSQDVIKV